MATVFFENLKNLSTSGVDRTDTSILGIKTCRSDYTRPRGCD